MLNFIPYRFYLTADSNEEEYSSQILQKNSASKLIFKEESPNQARRKSLRASIDKEFADFLALFDKPEKDDTGSYLIEEKPKQPAITKSLLSKLNFFVWMLPGNLTPQKLTKLDVEPEDVQYFLLKYYETLLQVIVQNIDFILNQKSEDLNKIVAKCFILDGGDVTILHRVILSLVSVLETTKSHSFTMKFLLKIMEEVIKSNLLCSSLVLLSVKEFDYNLEEANDALHLVVTLSDKVFNWTKGKCCNFFAKEFSNYLLYHVGNFVTILTSVTEHLPNIDVKYNAIGNFTSKVLLRFSSSEGLRILLETFELWANHISSTRPIIYGVLLNLNKSAKEIVAFTILNFFKSAKTVKNVLADAVIRNPEFEYIVCTKLPLLNYFDHSKHQKFLPNLIGYLHLNSNKLVFNLMVEVLNYWCDKTAVNQTSLSQHFYLTQIIIFCGRFIENISDKDEKDKIRSLLFRGIPVHFDSSDEGTRALGMIAAELLIPKFINVKTEVALKFDYKNLSSQTQSYIDYLTNINLNTEDKIDGDGDMKLLTLICIKKEESTVEKVEDGNLNIKNPVENVNSLNETDVEENKINEVDEDDIAEIDSDDDLVPYDISNDVRTPKVPPPTYLRDLIDALADRQDVDKFCISFEAAEELIASQLGDDDEVVGTDLLQLFISINDSYGIDNFLTIKFNCCVRIICTHPIAGAEYVCNEINSSLNKYSVGDRLFMLDLLSASAKKLSELSNYQTDAVKPKTVTFIKDYEKGWEKIVRERILSNTRRFISRKKENIAKKNNFLQVAGYFFFPLVKDFGIPKLNFTKTERIDTIKDDVLVLTKFLETVSVITFCSKNSSICAKIVKEVMELVWGIRFHGEGKIRLAVMSCLASVFLAAPRVYLMTDLYEKVIDCRDWLVQCLSKDPDIACKDFAAQLCYLIKDIE